MRRLLVVAGILVALAGIQLFVFSERTETFFAWTIDPPLTAAFLGASYWSSALLEFTAARERRWANARIAVPTVFVFTVLTFIVTLVHLDRFHLGAEFAPGTRVVTGAWIAVYAVVPAIMATVWWVQTRQPGGVPAPRAPMPAGLRATVGLQAVALAVAGASLLAVPQSGWWPWDLTPLTGRAIGAWLVSLAVAAGHALGENSLRRLRPAAWALVAFGLLQGWALLRYPGDFAWTSPFGIGYLAFLVSALVVGVVSLRLSLRQFPARPA